MRIVVRLFAILAAVALPLNRVVLSERGQELLSLCG